MKKEKIEKFIVQPSVHLFYGVTVKKNTCFNEKTEDGEIEQELNNLTLITKINKKYNYQGIETVEKTILTQKIKEGIRLVWGEKEGYIISPYTMVTPAEAIEDLKVIKGC